MKFEPIGIIHTPFKTKDECPIQPVYSSDTEGEIEIFEEYAAGLKDIETFSHIYIIYLFDKAGEVRLVRPTFLDDEPHGVFASRHPCRPNSIGMSIVQLEKRNDNKITASGIDVLDGTPLLDIKPCMPRFDIVDSAVNGWAEGLEWRPKPGNRE